MMAAREMQDEIFCHLTRAGVSLDAMRRDVRQIVLFGSRAAGVAGPLSDWDLLLVGRPCGPAWEVPSMDLVWVDERTLSSSRWTDSELAGHVARYGVWLYGAPDWTSAVRCGAAAAERKSRRIASRIRAMDRAWSLLSRPHREECSTQIRRDLQRYSLLVRGEPVPPSRLLDSAWTSLRHPGAEMSALLQQVGVREHSEVVHWVVHDGRPLQE